MSVAYNIFRGLIEKSNQSRNWFQIYQLNVEEISVRSLEKSLVLMSSAVVLATSVTTFWSSQSTHLCRQVLCVCMSWVCAKHNVVLSLLKAFFHSCSINVSYSQCIFSFKLIFHSSFVFSIMGIWAVVTYNTFVLSHTVWATWPSPWPLTAFLISLF